MHRFLHAFLYILLSASTSLIAPPEQSVMQEEVIEEEVSEHPAPTSSDTAISKSPMLPQDTMRVYTAPTLSELIVDHETEITFAMVGSFSGHFKLYAEIIRNGILAQFNRVNKQGGIAGKMLRLICIHDESNPAHAQRIINVLHKKHKVTMFLGCMGSRNILHTLPLIQSKKIAMFFPWGGNEELRDPNLPNLINGLGNLTPQLQMLVSYATQALRLRKIALFYSDGTFNTEAKNKAVDLLAEQGIAPIITASYNRQTMDINTPAEKIIKTDPKVVLCLGSSRPTAKLISRFFELGHYGTTFIGIDSTMFVSDILREKGASYAYASTVPDPIKSITPIAQEYRHDMEEFFPEDILNVLSFSYYIHAKIMIEAMSQVVSQALPPDKQAIIAAIEDMKNMDLSGFAVNFDPSTRHAYPHVVVIIKDQQ